jgi:hypothetical protein
LKAANSGPAEFGAAAGAEAAGTAGGETADAPIAGTAGRDTADAPKASTPLTIIVASRRIAIQVTR